MRIAPEPLDSGTGPQCATAGILEEPVHREDRPLGAADLVATQIVGVADKEVQARLWKFKDDLAEGLKL